MAGPKIDGIPIIETIEIEASPFHGYTARVGAGVTEIYNTDVTPALIATLPTDAVRALIEHDDPHTRAIIEDLSRDLGLSKSETSSQAARLTACLNEVAVHIDERYRAHQALNGTHAPLLGEAHLDQRIKILIREMKAQIDDSAEAKVSTDQVLQEAHEELAREIQPRTQVGLPMKIACVLQRLDEARGMLTDVSVLFDDLDVPRRTVFAMTPKFFTQRCQLLRDRHRELWNSQTNLDAVLDVLTTAGFTEGTILARVKQIVDRSNCGDLGSTIFMPLLARIRAVEDINRMLDGPDDSTVMKCIKAAVRSLAQLPPEKHFSRITDAPIFDGATRPCPLAVSSPIGAPPPGCRNCRHRDLCRCPCNQSTLQRR